MKVVNEDAMFAIAEKVADGRLSVEDAHAALRAIAEDAPDDYAYDARCAAVIADLEAEARAVRPPTIRNRYR